MACFDEILLGVSKFPKPRETQTICKLPAVNPATSAADEPFILICTASEDVASDPGWVT